MARQKLQTRDNTIIIPLVCFWLRPNSPTFDWSENVSNIFIYSFTLFSKIIHRKIICDANIAIAFIPKIYRWVRNARHSRLDSANIFFLFPLYFIFCLFWKNMNLFERVQTSALRVISGKKYISYYYYWRFNLHSNKTSFESNKVKLHGFKLWDALVSSRFPYTFSTFLL